MFNRSSRTHITVIANNRMIKNNKIIKAVTEAFKTYLPVGKYPIVFLKIDLDPLLIDVNVHPQKLEVKFTEERMLVSLITNTLKDTLKELMLIPSMKSIQKVEETFTPSLDLRISEEPLPSTYRVNNENYPKNDLKVEREEVSTPVITQEIEPVKTKIQEQTNTEIIKPVRTYKIPQLHHIGQYLGTYLIAQNEEGLYIIDQHAAAERVRYENYVELFGNVTVSSTRLLIPLKLHLSNSEVLTLSDKLDSVHKLGLELSINEVLGVNIISVPSWFPKGFELSYTEEIVKYLLNDTEVSVKIIRERLAKNLSCKHSIKANKYININEINKLLDDLSKCENPYTCPHGRPVLIKWTQTEIEKMFKRIM